MVKYKTLFFLFWKFNVQISVWGPAVLTEGFVTFLTSGRQNDRIVPQLRP